jgi:hypothetical protein
MVKAAKQAWGYPPVGFGGGGVVVGVPLNLLHTLGPNSVVPLLINFTQGELPGNVIWYQ